MKKVIIAEDDEGWRERLIEIILSQGVKIEEVKNGPELVEKVKAGKYDLIFTDNSMPGGNGLEAIIEIRKFNKETPIYMVSVLLSEEEADLTKKEVLKYRGNGLINKRDDNFYDKIREIKKKHLGMI